MRHLTLREKCPNTEFFLVRIFLYSAWILKSPHSFRKQESADQKKQYLDTFYSVQMFLFCLLKLEKCIFMEHIEMRWDIYMFLKNKYRPAAKKTLSLHFELFFWKKRNLWTCQHQPAKNPPFLRTSPSGCFLRKFKTELQKWKRETEWPN